MKPIAYSTYTDCTAGRSENIHRCFLNVLCTFNVIPVSEVWGVSVLEKNNVVMEILIGMHAVA